MEKIISEYKRGEKKADVQSVNYSDKPYRIDWNICVTNYFHVKDLKAVIKGFNDADLVTFDKSKRYPLTRFDLVVSMYHKNSRRIKPIKK